MNCRNVRMNDNGAILVKPIYRYDLVIAGAGIIGASVAWHAIQRGLKVAILDAQGPAAASSGASDGAVSVATKRPGLMASLAGESLLYTGALAQKGSVLEGIFHPRPSFLFARSVQEMEALDALSSAISQQNLPVDIRFDGSPTTSRVHGLGTAVKRIMEIRGEGHMLGYQATFRYLSASRCDHYWPCELHGFETCNRGITVFSSRGNFFCDNLVIATGLGTRPLLPELPLIARSGQLIVTERGNKCLPGPLTSAAYLLDKTPLGNRSAEAPVVIDPLSTGQMLIGSSREDNGNATHTDIATVRRLTQSAVDCLPEIAARRIIRVFAGVRTATADGLPIVGSLPEHPNIICATGFEGDGICLSALVGREIVAQMTVGKMHSKFASLSPSRFVAKEEIQA
jgi:glycine/D-amino acid oxidase-like deaminating enzyme